MFLVAEYAALILSILFSNAPTFFSVIPYLGHLVVSSPFVGHDMFEKYCHTYYPTWIVYHECPPCFIHVRSDSGE